MSKPVYIVLTQTRTIIARTIRLFTHKPYNHSSLSGDLALSEMYSFCRNYIPFPLPASFNREKVDAGVFGLFPQIPCEIYKIELTDAQRERYDEIIKNFNVHCAEFKFNVIGFATIYFQKDVERSGKYTCSQFVAYTLSECGLKLDKSPYLYSPDDLRSVKGAELVYTGELNEYYHSHRSDSVATAL